MTTPRSLTSSRYTGAAARRSLERVSVVSSITSCPIHASGILFSEALGLSLSITAPSSFRSRKGRIPYPKHAALRLRRGEDEGRVGILTLTRGLQLASSPIAGCLLLVRFLFGNGATSIIPPTTLRERLGTRNEWRAERRLLAEAVRGMSEREPVRVPKDVLEGLEAVRRYARTDVLDIATVRFLGQERGQGALVVWIDKHPQEYGRGLLEGFRAD